MLRALAGILPFAALLVLVPSRLTGADAGSIRAPLPCSADAPCDTWDPDVWCYNNGITWQSACKGGMEWCDGH